MNTRAKNDYDDRDVVMVFAAFFPHGAVNKFFEYHGYKIDTDVHRLSGLLQFVFRSAIRKEKPIDLYLPSEELRMLLGKWLEREAVLMAA